MLKLDFYKALEAGHIIRKCQNCGRYFLLQKGYHTKYCDLPNPANPKYTCAQLGYRLRGIKEDAEGSPLAQALYRCYQRIDKDRSRGVITAEERTRLREKRRNCTTRREPNRARLTRRSILPWLRSSCTRAAALRERAVPGDGQRKKADSKGKEGGGA